MDITHAALCKAFNFLVERGFTKEEAVKKVVTYILLHYCASKNERENIK